MKRHLFGLIWALLPPIAAADTLTVDVAGVESDEGNLLLSLMASQASFDSGEPPPVAQRSVPAEPGTMVIKIEDLEPGEYGIRVMHDVNANFEMDSNLVGMPTEPWGFSNDAFGRFGPPDWDGVKFTVSGDTNITINLNH